MGNVYFQQTINDINEINNIQKFYLFYHSSLVTFNLGIENILQNISIELNSPQIIISHLTNLPDKPHQRIDVEIDDLKQYALNEGRNFVFRSCIIYLYSLLENLIVYIRYNKTTDECCKFINKDILISVIANKEDREFIYKLKELRNSFIHDNSIWSKKRAKNLSNAIEGLENENFSLILEDIEIKVNEKIRFLDSIQFKWVIDRSIEIVKSVEQMK